MARLKSGNLKDRDRGFESYLSASRTLVIIALSIFVAEALVMVFLHMVPLGPLARVLMDPALLVILLLPLLYSLLFRPMLLHINQRRRAEEDLKKAHARVQTYLDIAGVMLLVLDRGARVRLINRKGCEILGYEEKEVLGKDWIENFVPERLRKEVREGFDELVKGRREYWSYFENPVVTKSGEERDMLWHNITVMEEGVVTGTLSSGEDITGRKRAEKALKESEIRYRSIHNASFDAIIISDSSDRIIDCNKSAEKIFGYSRDELEGREISDLMPRKYRDAHKKGVKRFLESGTSTIQGKVMEYEGLRKNGEAFPIELSLSHFSIAGEMNFAGTIRDITERRLAESEKERIQTQLSQSQKMEAIGRFAGGIAHDFNNILTAIRGNAELAMEGVDKSDPVYSKLEGVILSVLHASKLTKQLLLFSKGQPFELLPLNISTVIENLLSMITRIIGEDITVSTELAPDLWTVEADEGNMEQVVMNLAVNARDAMPQGGKLSIKAQNVIVDESDLKAFPEARPGKAICLTVSDTGKGMEKSLVQHIFEPFFTTKEPGKGTGFGLALVYGIIKNHNGWISIQSAPGAGTTFRIYIPAVEIREGLQPAPGAPPQPGEAAKKARLLLVESEPTVREFARYALIRNGYSVAEARDGASALEAFEKEAGEFDLVICDAAILGRNGRSLVERLQSIRPGVSLLLTSSFLDAGPLSSSSGYKYLQKPYSLSSLLKEVAASIERGGIKR